MRRGDNSSPAAQAASPRFNILVPDSFKDVDDVHAAQYAFESAEFTEHELGLKTIFMKSYSQLNQAISDLSLAVLEPRYRSRGVSKDKSLVYGDRLVRALEATYRKIGCSGAGQVPVGINAEYLNTRLYNALRAHKGPIAVLKRLGKARGTSVRRCGW